MRASTRCACSLVVLFACWDGSAVAQDATAAGPASQTTKPEFVDPVTSQEFSHRLLFGGKVTGSAEDRALSQEAADQLRTPIRAVRKGDEVVVRVKDPDCRFDRLQFEEKERNPRFYDDVHAVIAKLPILHAAAPVCPRVIESRYKLEHNRSTLTITALGTNEKDNSSITVLTGPKEHFYLGVDLPSTRKTVKYDSSSKTLQPQSDNPQVYISVNYSFGDVLTEEKNFKRLSFDRVQLKALFLPSKRPLDSFGVGAGYQLPRFDAVDLSAMSVFLGHFWTKQDAVSSTGAPQTNAATGHDWRVGITYDVATGLKWIKSN